jgi:hypothetical protein
MAKYNVYGNAADLGSFQTQMGKYSANPADYNLVNTSQNFDPNKVQFDQNSVILGGTAAQGGIGNINTGNATRLYGSDSLGTASQIGNFLGNQYYTNQAASQVDSSYNQQVQNLKNSLANQLASYDSQKTGINSNYDMAVQKQNYNNAIGKNNYSNQTLGRGLGRSTIATTGLAGMDSGNKRQVGYIEQGRVNSLNDVDRMKTVAQNGYEDSVNAMSLDRQNKIAALANQLRSAAQSQEWQEKQFNADQKYRYDALAQDQNQFNANLQLQKSKAASGSSGNTNNESINSTYNGMLNDVMTVLNDNNATPAELDEFYAVLSDELQYQTGSDAAMIRGLLNQVAQKSALIKNTSQYRNDYTVADRLNKSLPSTTKTYYDMGINLMPTPKPKVSMNTVTSGSVTPSNLTGGSTIADYLKKLGY